MGTGGSAVGIDRARLLELGVGRLPLLLGGGEAAFGLLVGLLRAARVLLSGQVMTAELLRPCPARAQNRALRAGPRVAAAALKTTQTRRGHHDDGQNVPADGV